MAGDRFPYDMQGHQALVTLINQTFPHYGLVPSKVEFSEPFHSPTTTEPGRTYIEAENTLYDHFMWFRYRRLDLAIALADIVTIYIDGVITPKRIAEELNRTHSMRFTDRDVLFYDFPLAPAGNTVMYRLRALPSSYVWYGETLIECRPIPSGTVGQRLMEDGTVRLTESGEPRFIE